MKPIVIASFLAVLAACAQLPDRVSHPFAASGGSASSDSAGNTQFASPYPYNSPYGI
ncbi:MAG TPA: hypothetical protein VM183_20865 [Burkholderiales bacterium]|nr:hypothetical protein [Burkholderiales bacterium]